jgi:hypothetical protein
MLGINERFFVLVCIYHLLLLLLLNSYICFHNTGSICYFGIVSHTGFKFGILATTDPMWKASSICNLLLYIPCCFTGITNDLQCLQIRIKNAKACCILSLDYIVQSGKAGLGLVRHGLDQCFILKYKMTPHF